MPLCRIILENEMDCINPSPLCGVGHIGETPKKQQFLRRGVKKQPNRLLTKLNPSVTHVTPPLYFALQNTGEEVKQGRSPRIPY